MQQRGTMNMNTLSSAWRPRHAAAVALALLWLGFPGANVRAAPVESEWSDSDVCLRDYIVHPGLSKFYDHALYRRLEVGARSQYVSLRDKSTTRFEDSGKPIDPSTPGYSAKAMDEEQKVRPLPFARYRFTPYFAAELGWESIHAKANPFWDDRTDGTVTARGPALLFHARLPTRTRATPFAALGLALLDGRFNMNPDWHEGTDPRTGDLITRNMSVNNPVGFIVSGGCDVRLRHRLSLNLTLRYMDAEVEADYYVRHVDESRSNVTRVTLPLDNWAAQCGLVYAF
jgi:hypothetical protein